MIRMVPRGVSTTADAYLTPVLGDYLDGFYAGFAGGRKGGLKVEFMGSDGGLVNLDVCQLWFSPKSRLMNRTLPVSTRF
jgi:N-methylhydantoinase A/oxoprolinase/acetone carboxylase beta subunit